MKASLKRMIVHPGLSVLAFGFSFVLQSCSNHEPPATPSDAVRKMYSALTAQDTAALIEAAAAGRREAYRKNPQILKSTLDHWKGKQARIEVISEKTDGYIGNVWYRLFISGKEQKKQDSLQIQVYNEEGTWRYGY